MLKDFQEFINRGNVVDLAVGVIIGAAFAPIIASLVDNVIMPPIGLLLGGIDFSAFGFILRDADQYASVPAAIEAGAPVIAYGVFINAVINFLITAAAVFVVIRSYERAKRRWEARAEESPEEPPKPPQNEVLLAEIRDLLAAQNRGASAGD